MRDKNEQAKYVLILFMALMVAVLLGMAFWARTNAGGEKPEGLYEWAREDGSICSAIVTDNSVALDCDCPCENDCNMSFPWESYDVPEPTQEVVKEPTPYNTEVVTTPEPTNKPPDPTTAPPEKVKCNSGRGNSSEGDPDCDPGNSGGNNQGGD